MAQSYVIVKGTEGTMTVTFKDSAGTAINFAGSTATFRADTDPHTGDIEDSGGNVIDDATATVEATQGQLSYTFTTGDTATAQRLRGRFHVTFADGHVEAFPRPGWLTIEIEGDILDG